MPANKRLKEHEREEVDLLELHLKFLLSEIGRRKKNAEPKEDSRKPLVQPNNKPIDIKATGRMSLRSEH